MYMWVSKLMHLPFALKFSKFPSECNRSDNFGNKVDVLLGSSKFPIYIYPGVEVA